MELSLLSKVSKSLDSLHWTHQALLSLHREKKQRFEAIAQEQVQMLL